MTRSSVAAAVLILLCSEAAAQEVVPPVNRWTGDVELGLNYTSGNTDVDTALFRVDVDYHTMRWRHNLFGDVYQAEQDGVDTADRYSAGYKPQYQLSEKNYVFGLLRYDADEFAGIDRQLTGVVGFGRQILAEEDESLAVEVGVGARNTDYLPLPSTIGLKDDEIIGFVSGSYDVALSDSSRFTQDVRVEVGEDNTFVESVTGLAMTIVGSVAARLSYTVRHNTDIEGLQGTNTDTIFGVSLLYSF